MRTTPDSELEDDDSLRNAGRGRNASGIRRGDTDCSQDGCNDSFGQDSVAQDKLEAAEVAPKMSRKDSKLSRQRSTTTSIFLDPEQVKKMVKGNMQKPAYSVEGFYHSDGLWQLIARHPRFEQLTLGVIMLNAVWIAVDTDRNDAAALLDAEPIFQIAEHFFCVYFSFEWTVRFMAFKVKRDGLRDRWFVFDSCLVFMMVGETWIVTTVLLFVQTGGSSTGLGSASILRLFRLLRLSRMARMLRSFPELMILIKGITAAMRSVVLVMCLLVITMYIFAIAFTQLAEETSMGKRYFASVGTSMYSLLVYGTFLDNLAGVCMDIKNESAICLALFFVFIVFSALTLMNMLIGVLCEMVSTITATEKEVRIVDFVTGKLEAILDTLDEDGDKRISRVEFAKILQIPEAVLALDEVGVDPVGIMDFADFIFDDANVEEDGLAFQEFMDVILKLRGSNTATVKDVVDLRRFILASLEHLQFSLLNVNGPKTKMSLRRLSSVKSSRSKRSNPGESFVAKQGSIAENSDVEPVSFFMDGGFADSGPESPVSPASPASGRVSAGRGPLSAKLDEAEGGEREVMKRLQTRVERLEDSLATLLGEVRKMTERLPPVPPAAGLDGVAAAGGRSALLPHLLHKSEDASFPMDKRSLDVPSQEAERAMLSARSRDLSDGKTSAGTLL